jgi:TRAP-type C4-dicarboxylate transport system substrate-binding protein
VTKLAGAFMGTTAVFAAISLAACGSGQASKSGAVTVKKTILRLQVTDAVDADRDFLVKDVARISHGALQVEVASTAAYDSTDPAKEAQLVTDLRSGKVDFGYVGARDFAAAGSTDFQAVDAPFVITTSTASQQFAASALATKYLGGLQSLGVVGIGIIPSEPRGFTSRKPLITPADFVGGRIRIIDNPQTQAMVSALGAVPVQKLLSTQVNSKLRDGSLDAVESSPSNVRGNAYQTTAPYSTTYAVFPKLNVLGANSSAWSQLSAANQSYLKQAAADTLTEAAQVPLREGQALTDTCKSGMVLEQPSPTDFAVIVKKAQAGTADSAAVHKAISAIRESISGSGPRVQMIALPPECKVASTTASAVAAHGQLVTQTFQHQGGAQIPDGTYATTTTVADLRAGGQTGADWNKDIVWTWRLHNGQVQETQQPDYPDQGGCNGTYAIHGDEVTFTWEASCGLAPETVKWSNYEGKLSFAIVDVADTASKIIYSAHPWQKVS